MGCKYTIRFVRNGNCPYDFDRQTNNVFKALCYLFTLSLKYPIVDLQIRRGYIKCEECTADWCDKSPDFPESEEEKSKYDHPECYEAEENNPYPLCIGKFVDNKLNSECKECCLYCEYETYNDPYPQYDRQK